MMILGPAWRLQLAGMCRRHQKLGAETQPAGIVDQARVKRILMPGRGMELKLTYIY